MSAFIPVPIPMPEHQAYDFNSEENAGKWKGLFLASLEKVLREVHQSLEGRKDALDYVEDLIIKVLPVLCSSNPHTVADIEDRVHKKFPKPIQQWAIKDAQAAIEKAAKNKKNLQMALPVDKIHTILVKEVLGYKIDFQVTVYITAVLEYIAADIFKLTGNYVKNIRHSEISMQDIRVAMCADKVLMEMFFPDDDDDTITMTQELGGVESVSGSQTYDELVRDLLLEENQYLRELNMIIHVFRSEFFTLFPRSKDIDVIFSNIMDIQALTQSIISEIDDVIEATEENEIPYIGSCFDDLFEAEEFFGYERYADDILKDNGRMRLSALIQNERVVGAFKALNSGIGCVDAAKYVLPGLLYGPIFHFLHFCDILKIFFEISADEEDKVSLMQFIDHLSPIKSQCEKLLAFKNISWRNSSCFSATSVRRQRGRTCPPTTLNNMNEIQKLIDGWEGRDIGQSCTHLLKEGPLQKVIGRRSTERHVFLFDSLIILTKPNTRRSSVTTGVSGEYRLKEKYQIRKIDILDNPDTDELKNSFTLQVRDSTSIVLAARTSDEKFVWMSHLVQLSTWSMLERLLDSKMKEAERQQPFRLPSADEYIFAEQDSENNIVFEEKQESKECPLIRGGTLPKLVERLTFHTYADPKFVRTFLTTFRTFCTQEEFLDLLIKRFNIPEAQYNEEEADPNSEQTIQAREERKRFRNEYVKPVQFRVLNVMRHWVDQHWYDFESASLLKKLKAFLDSVKGKAMRKWVGTISKIIARKSTPGEKIPKNISYKTKHPPIEWHLTQEPRDFDIMTLHPIEIARQITLREFELYQSIMPSELVGTVWMKDKYRHSTNLLTTIQQSTKFTFWLEKCIVEAENFEERVSVVSRIIEVMLVLEELNNFTGILEVLSALNSASIYRLKHTFDELDRKIMRGFTKLKTLSENRHKRLLDRLRSIDPPCVPFLGIYLTNILYTEEGNPDFLLNRPTEMINFSKRRKVAEITAEIQQYQNQPYCLTVVPSIREYLDNLDPLGGMTEKEFEDYLYQKSMEIEPRNSKQLPKFERKRDYVLKSPGIKPGARHGLIPPYGRLERHVPSNLSSTTSVNSLAQPGCVNSGSSFIDTDLSNSDADMSTPPTTPNTPISPPHESGENRCDFNPDTVSISDSSYRGSMSSRCSSVSTLRGADSASTRSSISSLVSICSSNTNCKEITQAFGFSSPAALNENTDKPPALPPRVSRSSTLSLRGMPDHEISSPSWFSPASYSGANNSVFVMEDVASDRPPMIPPRLKPRQVHQHQQYGGASSLAPPPSPPGINEGPELPPKTYRHSHSRQSSS